jgi:uncharacterized protein YyaL (SSP411 family)
MKLLSTATINYGIRLLIVFTMITSCANSQKTEKEVTKEHKHTNSLINESSPYLLQHAHNPVNWMPWGDEAFEKAKKENKLVLISIGYSSCHWCHVMEHESFENETVAKMMNDYFVCIKVDREERPDVDQIYMTAVQLMTGSGGWPLNCFTLPDGGPVYGGTYFPKDQWTTILENLYTTYTQDKQKMLDYAENLTTGIKQSELIESPAPASKFTLKKLDELAGIWKSNFDTKDGGMNRAPKFPIPNNYDYLMQYGHYKNDNAILSQVDLTLTKMANGGIYDQVGGGFARYSTDTKWKAPHFEKMMYDNAQMVSLYSKAYQRTNNPLYKNIVYETLEWVKREMTTKDGAFYSALDADSEGEEGKFYVWSKAELKEILTEEEYLTIKDYYEINPKGLWEGNYILLRDADKVYSETVYTKMKPINAKLLAKRAERVRPGLDDKSLTAWNAMMLKGYCDAYAIFNDDTFLKAALKNAKWLLKKQTKKDGSLFHTFKNGESKIDGFLDDYAFTITAYLALYEVTFDEKWLTEAKKLTDYSIAHFEDKKSGMFYFTSNSSGTLIARKMEINDNVIPASNSQIARVLFKLGTILNNKSYIDKSKQMLSNVYKNMHTYPSGYSNWSILALNLTNTYYEVAITGNNWANKLNELNTHYIPNKLIMGGLKSDLELLKGKFLDETTIFVCQHGSCQMPTNEISKAVTQMK